MSGWVYFKKLSKQITECDRLIIEKHVVDEKKFSGGFQIINSRGQTAKDLIVFNLKKMLHGEFRDHEVENIWEDGYFNKDHHLEFLSVAYSLCDDNAKSGLKTKRISRFRDKSAIFHDVGWDEGFRSCDGKIFKLPLLLAWYFYKSSIDKDWENNKISAKKWLENFNQQYGLDLKFKPVEPSANFSSIEEFDKLFSKEDEAGGETQEQGKESEPPSQSKNPQPILHIPGKEKTDKGYTLSHRFEAKGLEVIGRKKEQQILRDFVTQEIRSFRWMQIAGDGGQGKSRLALDLINEIKDKWDAGFLDVEELSSFKYLWREWLPTKPTLFVIDYVIADMMNLKKLFYYLPLRASEFRYPVRLLIIERQRWDASNRVEANSVTLVSQNANIIEDSADWFSSILGKRVAVNRFVEFSNDPSVIKLKKLKKNDLVDITKDWASEISRDGGLRELPSDSEIESKLHEIDSTGRPLYAYFLAEALINGHEISTLDQGALLNSVLFRDIEYRWSQYYEGKAPSMEENDPALNLAVLSTMVRKVDVAELAKFPQWPKYLPETRRKALAITDSPIATKKVSKTVSGLQPDILGGWLVAETVVGGGVPIELIVETAWNIRPNEMAACLVRLMRDHPNHSGTQRLFMVDLPNCKFASDAAAGIANTLLGYYLESQTPVSPQVVKWLTNAAVKGSPVAMLNLGFCYNHGHGLDKDLNKAVCWYQKAANAGSPIAMTNLGICYENGSGIKTDFVKARHWYRKGANANNKNAMNSLAKLYAFGKGTAKDHYEAIYWYRKAAEANHFGAMGSLGICYAQGLGVAQDYAEAVSWFRKGAANYDGASMSHLGFCFRHGNGVKQDLNKAIDWYQKGIVAGSSEAINNLGICYQNGLGVEKDYIKAVNLFREGAKSGNLQSLTNLGVCYEIGIGVEEDPIQALEFYERAAKSGFTMAMTNLGHLYEKGTDVKQDYALAALWYKKASEAKDKIAMANLGVLYLDGSGVEQNYNKAIKLFRSAASAGSEAAMRGMWLCYKNGYGVEKDDAMADFWFERAENHSS